MPRLTQAEIDDFLNERDHLLRVGTLDEDGTPRVLPVWFIYRDGMVMFTPRGRSVLAANLQRDGRVGLSIDEDEGPYRKVAAQGVARRLFEPGQDAEWRDIYREIACRYTPPEWADAYIQNTIDQPRALVGVSLGESRVSTWRMPLAGEDPRGIWAKRYYGPDDAARA
jgi:nitroimidazol reductase NimA-like FMN-containing flavoprotein (pyridoxamine 5'-phosphate oxidase superfamily)